jgi:hypothetical protein
VSPLPSPSSQLLPQGHEDGPPPKLTQAELEEVERLQRTKSKVKADSGFEGKDEEMLDNLSRKSQWIVLALASGGCAAVNGVFAKL